MGNIVIVSDLHIGDRSKADDFFTSGNYLEFIRFVKWIEQNDSIDKLIIAGDLFELWQCKIEKALQMYIDVWKAFIRLTKSNKEVIYVPGNHDSLPFAKLAYKAAPFPIGSLKLTDQTDLDQKKKLIFPYYMESNLWIEHGHRFDKYNHASSELAGGSKGLLGRFIAKVVGIAERSISKDIDEKLWDIYESTSEVFRSLKEKLTNPFYQVADNIQSYITPSSDKYQGNLEEYAEGAYKLGEDVLKKSKDISKVFIVFGHTHKPLLRKIDNHIIYANAGSWVEKTATFCLFDPSTNSINLYEWNDGKAMKIDQLS
ncbi:UDP-2,3-diacylglucosamine diphosphatase [Kosmotoga olearia]|uniref:Metallophosphoesterase n=1 Tax=Kosmotoga olearia (strain ATCC BAA-1733 / DSM 21960 / TBF 19.5.1) TaxID=521045 RepID=C5CDA5_KOSOT|nr:metallophosphoesterase [Kosmotoga olearia]ACR79968.1 metallophosphoesterase [Kosmotoga olearia TBF 19.5.1]